MAMTKFNNWKKTNEGMEGPATSPVNELEPSGLDKKLARYMGGTTAQGRVEDILAGVADQNMINQVKVAMDLLGNLVAKLDDNKKAQFVNVIKTKLNTIK